MNVKYFAEKLGHIDDDLVEEAATASAGVKGIRLSRRHFAALVAAAILILASFTTALAVNDDFRAAVISFFNIGNAETIPQSDNTSETDKIHIDSTSNVDGLVNINYLKLDESYEYNDSVIFTYSKSGDFSNGAYYRVVDDQLIPTATKRVETTFDFREYSWSVRFDYTIIDGKLYTHNIPDSQLPEIADSEAVSCYASAMKGENTQKVLLRLPFPHASLLDYSEYYVIFDIKTGEITDFLKGSRLDRLTDFTHEIDFNDDFTRAIVTTYNSATYNGYQETYYCDIPGKNLVPLKKVTGQDVAADEEIECWFLDNDTLFFYTAQSTDGQRINLKTDQKATSFTGLRPYNDADGGLQFLGGRYALNITYDRKVSLLDLLKGTQTPIDRFAFTTLTGAVMNEDMTKIFFMIYNEDDLQIGHLGVLDIQKSRLLLLDRKGQEVRSEYGVDWFDNDRHFNECFGRWN
ncbi:MAG: hypothetical protein K0Q48_521 [Bacillota bacterium]|jgi:hypothetical protein|nr:hypothetical protein [Bacillota bacterium]